MHGPGYNSGVSATKQDSRLVVPVSVQRKAGIKVGELLEYRAARGVITIVAKRPLPADEPTPAQRRAIDSRLEKARRGPYVGPFQTAEEMAASIESAIKRTQRPAKKLPKTG